MNVNACSRNKTFITNSYGQFSARNKVQCNHEASGLGSYHLLPHERGLLLNLHVGLIHDAGLTGGDSGVDGSCNEGQPCSHRKDHLHDEAVFAIGASMNAVSFWRLQSGDGPSYIFLCLLCCFTCIAYDTYLFTANLLDRAQRIGQLFQRFGFTKEHSVVK